MELTAGVYVCVCVRERERDVNGLDRVKRESAGDGHFKRKYCFKSIRIMQQFIK